MPLILPSTTHLAAATSNLRAQSSPTGSILSLGYGSIVSSDRTLACFSVHTFPLAPATPPPVFLPIVGFVWSSCGRDAVFFFGGRAAEAPILLGAALSFLRLMRSTPLGGSCLPPMFPWGWWWWTFFFVTPFFWPTGPVFAFPARTAALFVDLRTAGLIVSAFVAGARGVNGAGVVAAAAVTGGPLPHEEEEELPPAGGLEEDARFRFPVGARFVSMDATSLAADRWFFLLSPFPLLGGRPAATSLCASAVVFEDPAPPPTSLFFLRLPQELLLLLLLVVQPVVSLSSSLVLSL